MFFIVDTKNKPPHTQHTHKNYQLQKQGLEDQLLALVVGHERPDLQDAQAALVAELNGYTISLKDLEARLLARLAAAQVCVGRGGGGGGGTILRARATPINQHPTQNTQQHPIKQKNQTTRATSWRTSS